MRFASIFACVLLALSTPAYALPAKPQSVVTRVTQKTTQLVRKQAAVFKAKLVDPAKRKRLIGDTALTLGTTALGMALDGALMTFGIPPLTATLLSSGLPTLAQYFAQRKLQLRAPAWFDEQEHLRPHQLAFEVGFAAATGWLGGNLVDYGASKLTSSLAVVGGRLSIGAANHVMKGISTGATWIGKQVAYQKASDAFDHARDKLDLGTRIKGWLHAQKHAPAAL